MFRKAVLLALTLSAAAIGVAVSCAAGPCDGNSCFGPVLLVTSPADDLLSASGCGRSVTCTPAPCGELAVSPPVDGGVCVTTVTFEDGSTQAITLDWGTAHPQPCCGPTYDLAGATVRLHDASPD